jgi:hypothetical protein
MAVKGLGRLFDVGTAIQTVADLAGQSNTGFRVNMKNYSGIAFIVYMNAVSAGTDTFVPDVQQHTAASSGTSADLDVVTEWYIKHEATLDGDETWTRVTQSAASEVSLTGATYTGQLILVIEVGADQLSDGYGWVSLDIADPGTGGTRVGGALWIGYGLARQQRPDGLPQPNAA